MDYRLWQVFVLFTLLIITMITLMKTHIKNHRLRIEISELDGYIDLRDAKIKSKDEEIKIKSEVNILLQSRIDELQKERNDLKERNYLLCRELKYGVSQDVDDASMDCMFQGLDRLILSVPPCNGKTLISDIRQQFFNDFIANKKNEVESRILKQEEPTESKYECACGSTPRQDLYECECGSEEFTHLRSTENSGIKGEIPYNETEYQCVRCGRLHNIKTKMWGTNIQKDRVIKKES